MFGIYYTSLLLIGLSTSNAYNPYRRLQYLAIGGFAVTTNTGQEARNFEMYRGAFVPSAKSIIIPTHK